MATCLEIAGAAYPDENDGNPVYPLEGTSLVPVFDNRDNGKGVLYWEHEGNRAVRRENWKLVLKYPGDWELYDMEADRTELNDVSAKYPDMVKELSGLHEDWADRCHVQPWKDILDSREKKP